MHKLYLITVLICISVRHFLMSVYYLCFLFVHCLFIFLPIYIEVDGFPFSFHELSVQYGERFFPSIFDESIFPSLSAFLFELR